MKNLDYQETNLTKISTSYMGGILRATIEVDCKKTLDKILKSHADEPVGAATIRQVAESIQDAIFDISCVANFETDERWRLRYVMGIDE